MFTRIHTTLFIAALFITSVVFAQPPLPPVPQPTFNVSLSWVAPTLNEDGSALTDLALYRLSYSTTPGPWNTIDINDPQAVMHVLTQNTLQPNTRYYFAIQACNVAGICSRYSNIAESTTPDIAQPNPPTNVTVNITFSAGV